MWKCLWFHWSCGELFSIHPEYFFKISLGHFQIRGESLWSERYGFSIRTYKNTTCWNLVVPRAVFSVAVSCVDNFLGNNLFWAHFQIRSESLWAERYEDLIQTYQSITYWNLVANHEVLARAGFCVDNFWKTICFEGISKYGVKVFAQSVIIFDWNMRKHNILEFGGSWWSICLGSALCGQLLGNKCLWLIFE